MKIYGKCASEPYSFFGYRFHTTGKHFSKIQKKPFGFFIKMTLTDELKTLNDKIKANQANMIQIEKQLKFYHYHLKNWVSMNI